MGVTVTIFLHFIVRFVGTANHTIPYKNRLGENVSKINKKD